MTARRMFVKGGKWRENFLLSVLKLFFNRFPYNRYERHKLTLVTVFIQLGLDSMFYSIFFYKWPEKISPLLKPLSVHDFNTLHPKQQYILLFYGLCSTDAGAASLNIMKLFHIINLSTIISCCYRYIAQQSRQLFSTTMVDKQSKSKNFYHVIHRQQC
jgi:hypothetical protein